MDEAELERRVIALETALAHLQAEFRDLSDVIAGQWQTIDRLGRRVDRAEALVRRLDVGREDDGEGASSGPE